MTSSEQIGPSWMISLVNFLHHSASTRSKRFQNRDLHMGSDWAQCPSPDRRRTNSKPDQADEIMKMSVARFTPSASPQSQTVPTHSRVSPVPTGGGILFPPLALNGEGLASMDRKTLDACLEPIRTALVSIDAASMLDLERVQSNGAILDENLQVKPIHDKVMPPKRRNGSVVRYVHLTELPDQYSIGIFIFPPHAKIPLHDHPGMCVLSRVLYGDLTRRSLDLLPPEEDMDPSMVIEDPEANEYDSERSRPWFPLFPPYLTRSSSSLSEPPPRLPDGSKRAYLNATDHLQAPDVTALYPVEGNLHEFVAGPNGAAVLDVLLPPYDGNHGRDCTFYHIHEDEPSHPKHNGPRWIVPTGQPEDFHCISGRYGDLGEE